MGVDLHSHVPIYEQIIEHIHGSVAAGVYQPGEPLPSVRALALNLLVNPNTVQRAYQELERQAMVTTRRGLGVFVASNGDQIAHRWLENVVRARLQRSIRTGRSAGMTDPHLRKLFEHALQTEHATPDLATRSDASSESPVIEVDNEERQT